MSIGENIKRLREEHRLTQREIGEIAGVSDKAVSTWENGLKDPRMPALHKLAAYFGVSVGTLLEDRPAHTTAFGEAIDRLCAAWGRTRDRVERDISLPHGRMLSLCRGDDTPTEQELAKLSGYFRVPYSVLLGERTPIDESNITPLSGALNAPTLIPVLGKVPAGVPIEAVEDIIEHIPLSADLEGDGHDYFGLSVRGDSMFPEYRDGDIVVLRVQPTAETGDDVLAYIGDCDATLKRFALMDDGIQLRPVNPAYPVRSFTHSEAETIPVTVGGIVVELRRKRGR